MEPQNVESLLTNTDLSSLDPIRTAMEVANITFSGSSSSSISKISVIDSTADRATDELTFSSVLGEGKFIFDQEMGFNIPNNHQIVVANQPERNARFR